MRRFLYFEFDVANMNSKSIERYMTGISCEETQQISKAHCVPRNTARSNSPLAQQGTFSMANFQRVDRKKLE